jgi:hypothetical protein
VTARGHADATPERPDRTTAARRSLGPGRPLDHTVRQRMEAGFGRPFGDVRIHDDAAGATVARRLRARAFAVGTDVGFAAGRYRPGTLGGDALLAHELAHVVQQRGARPGVQAAGTGDIGPLERNADEGATAALTGAPWTPSRTGLRLQSCNGAGPDEREQEDTGAAEAPDAGVGAGAAGARPTTPPAQPGQPPAAAPRTTDEANVLDLSTLDWRPETSADAVLMLRGPDQKLYLLPARGLVYTPTPPPARAAQGPPNLASIGVPAAGHAGVYLVRTSRGAGLLVDAGGTARGQPNVLLPGSLAWIRARLGITQIVGALISHTHADHVANLESFVAQGLVTGNNVWVYPGWESAARGPLARAFQALRDARYTAQGFGPAWQPTRLQTQDLSGVTTARLQVGDATIEVFTRTADLQRYNRELAAGRTGTRFADAASMLARIRLSGATWDFTILGDIRGSTIADLHDQMGAAQFNALFRDTRVLGGFQHHLGAVNNARDVRGMTLLLRAARSAEFPLTIVVQTDAGRNATLIAQLQEAGARVIVLGDVDPASPAGVRIRTSGAVEARGAQVFEPSPVVQEARSRIENLTRAAEVLESHPGLIRVSGATHTEIARGLRTEAQRLRDAVYERQSLSIGETHVSTRRADYSSRLTANTTALQTPQGTAATLGEQSIRMLRRLHERAAEMQREVEAARTAGRASERLRRLVVEVEPSFARAVLADEFGRATSERGRVRALRRAEARLRRQVDLQRALTSGGGARISAGPRAVAVGLLALEIFNIVAPFIQYGVEQYRTRQQRDFYVFLTIASWWLDKAVPVPVRGRREGDVVPVDEDLTPSALRRIWNDTPAANRTATPPTTESRQLDALWIPPLAEWTNAQQLWDNFRLWVSIHINTFDDWASEFIDVPNPAVRVQGNIATGTWELRTGRLDDDGHVVEVWESLAELTRIMQATARAMTAGTERRIAEEWAERHEPVQTQPTISAPGSRVTPSIRPTAKARFRSGTAKPYGAYRTPPNTGDAPWVVRRLDTFSWLPDPVFLVYGGRDAPAGYTWVVPGDYNTAVAIRTNQTWFDDRENVVPIPKWYTPLYETIPREPEYSPRERAALDAATAGRATYYGYEVVRPSNPYRGEVHFPYLGPNVSGGVYVRTEDLVEFER